MSVLKRFLHDESAATAVEYAVMLGMILMACLATIGALGLETASLWSDNESGLQKAFANSE